MVSSGVVAGASVVVWLGRFLVPVGRLSQLLGEVEVLRVRSSYPLKARRAGNHFPKCGAAEHALTRLQACLVRFEYRRAYVLGLPGRRTSSVWRAAARSTGSGWRFFWPAAGIAALWMLRGRTRDQVVLDALAARRSSTVLNVVFDGIPLRGRCCSALANLMHGLHRTVSLARSQRATCRSGVRCRAACAGTPTCSTLGLGRWPAPSRARPLGAAGAVRHDRRRRPRGRARRGWCATPAAPSWCGRGAGMLTALCRDARAAAAGRPSDARSPDAHWLPRAGRRPVALTLMARPSWSSARPSSCRSPS